MTDPRIISDPHAFTLRTVWREIRWPDAIATLCVGSLCITACAVFWGA